MVINISIMLHMTVETRGKDSKGEVSCSHANLSEAEEEADTTQDPERLRGMLEHHVTTSLTSRCTAFTRLQRRDLCYRRQSEPLLKHAMNTIIWP